MLNLVAFVAIDRLPDLGGAVAEARAAKRATPANLTPFLPDEDLESRRLERVQGWALLFAAVVAVALPLYWLHEPTRQDRVDQLLRRERGRPRRGAVREPDDADVRRRGVAAVRELPRRRRAAAASRRSRSTASRSSGRRRRSTPSCCASTRTRRASTPTLRSRRTVCDVTDIITYGRPGTPMQAWGVDGGGPKNDQSIQDLVAYIESIQLTPEQAQKQAADALASRSPTRRPTRAPST